MFTTLTDDPLCSIAPGARYGANDPDAGEEQLRALMDQYERPLYGFLVTLVGPHEAVDQTQETFLRAYEHLCAGKSITKGWLYTVARRLALDHVQRCKRFHQQSELLEQLPEPQPSDRVALVRRSLAQLGSQDREVLYLFDVDGFTTAEIGLLMGISGPAVRQRLCRARERFRTIWHQISTEG